MNENEKAETQRKKAQIQRRDIVENQKDLKTEIGWLRRVFTKLRGLFSLALVLGLPFLSSDSLLPVMSAFAFKSDFKNLKTWGHRRRLLLPGFLVLNLYHDFFKLT